MNEQFPLGETSTIYMSGEQLYRIIQYDKPGYRQQVVLFPEKAQEIRDVAKAAIQEAEQRGAIKALREAASERNMHHLSDELSDDALEEAVRIINWIQDRADLLEGDDAQSST